MTLNITLFLVIVMYAVALSYMARRDKEDIFSKQDFGILVLYITLFLALYNTLKFPKVMYFNLSSAGLLSVVLLYVYIFKSKYIFGLNDIMILLFETIVLPPMTIAGVLVSYGLFHSLLTTIISYYKNKNRIFVVPFIYYHYITFLLTLPFYLYFVV